MKRQRYLLKIENPCKTDWTSMSGDDTARYCANCSRTVTDFTQLTDDQIIKKIRETKGKICGRLTEKQLHRAYILSEKGNTNTTFPKLLGGLLLLGLADNLSANGIKTETEIVKNIQIDYDGVQNKKEQPTADKDSLKNVIQGQIIDADTKEPLMFATITIKDKKEGTFSDLNGDFRMVFPDSLINDKLTLEINCIGYVKTEFLINKKDLPLLNKLFEIKAEHYLIGEVIIVKKK